MGSRINIENIEEGMVLSEPVLNKHGQVLLGTGIDLQKKHIRILKSWNISFVYIKDENQNENRKISKELMKLAVKDLKKIIKWKPINKNEVALINACAKYLVMNVYEK